MEAPLKDDGSIPDRRHRRARTAHIPNAASLTRFATAHPNSLVYPRSPEPPTTSTFATALESKSRMHMIREKAKRNSLKYYVRASTP